MRSGAALALVLRKGERAETRSSLPTILTAIEKFDPQVANPVGWIIGSSADLSRSENGLAQFDRMSQEHSKLGQIAQQPREFEFPRRSIPENVHFTGPWHDPSARPAVEFPFEKLDARPLIYASMGTLQNRQKHIFGIIAEACAGLDVQLVL